jgi:hypothetical protein
MLSLLGPGATRALVACDLYTFELIDGTAMYFTSFDRDVAFNNVVYSSATRLEIGAPGLPTISFKRGVNVDRLTLTLAPRAADPTDTGLTLAQAIVAGRLDGCRVTLMRTFNPLVSAQSPTAQVNPNLGTITLFVGLVSEVQIDRAIARMTIAPISELLNIQFPRHHLTTQCRWALFDAGCSNSRTVTDAAMTAGSAVLTSNTINFSATPDIGATGGQLATDDVGRPITVYGAGANGGKLVTSIASVQSPTQATLAASAATTVFGATATIGLLAENMAVSGTCAAGCTTTQIISNSLTQPPAYFSLGRIVFTSGRNQGVTRTIQNYLSPSSSGPNSGGLLAGALRYTTYSSYEAAVLADLPIAYWRLGQNGDDYSGNGNNLSVSGGVTFGEPGALSGDSMTSCYLDGSTGYLYNYNMVDPKTYPGTQAAITLEFWVKTPQTQAQGLFDSNPQGDQIASTYRQAPGTDALRGFNYGYGGWEWNPSTPQVYVTYPANTWTHVVVIFYGGQSINVFFNGRLAGAASAAGSGFYQWTGVQIGYNLFNYNLPGGYAWGVAGSGTPGSAPTQRGYYKVWFQGYLQEYAIYNYALSFQQITTHYQIGVNGPNSSGDGILTLWQALPYAPAEGDQFVAYPGCDKSMFACQHKFNNFNSFGGFPFTPNEETAL